MRVCASLIIRPSCSSTTSHQTVTVHARMHTFRCARTYDSNWQTVLTEIKVTQTLHSTEKGFPGGFTGDKNTLKYLIYSWQLPLEQILSLPHSGVATWVKWCLRPVAVTTEIIVSVAEVKLGAIMEMGLDMTGICLRRAVAVCVCVEDLWSNHKSPCSGSRGEEGVLLENRLWTEDT